MSNYGVAQEYLFDVQSIDTEDGLASLLTTSVFKDSDGLFWVGTKYGLNRYDGYGFSLYTKEQNNLFRNHDLSVIQEDDSGYLWLFYSKYGDNSKVSAVDIFDKTTGKATSLKDFFGEKLPFDAEFIGSGVDIDEQNRMWLSTKHGAVFTYKKGEFEKVFQQKKVDYSKLKIGKEGQFWLVHKNKLLGVDRNGSVFSSNTTDDAIDNLWLSGKNDITISTVKYKSLSVIVNFYKLNHATNSLQPFYFNHIKKSIEFPKGNTEIGYCRSDGTWFAKINKASTYASFIHVYDAQGNWIYDFKDRLDIEFRASIASFFEDNEFLWCATPLGVLKIKATDNPFYTVHKLDHFSDCRGITEDADGTIFFLNRGLYQFEPDAKKLTHLSEQIASYPLIVTDSFLWGGIYSSHFVGGEFDIRSHNFRKYPSYKGGIAKVLIESKNANQYLLGSKGGLSYIDLEQKGQLPFEKYGAYSELENADISFFHKNHQGIWAATDIGIFLLDSSEQVIAKFDKASGHLPFDNVRHIYEDSDGFFWVSTRGGGIFSWNVPKISNGKIIGKSTYRQFTKENGLSDNHIYAIYEDDFGHFWIPSDRGIMQFDKTDFSVRTYMVEDGILHNEFNESSHFKASDGTLYFGGLGGLISFHPKGFVQTKQNKTRLLFSSCKLLEGGAEKITDRSELLGTAQGITMRPSDKLLELNFALLDFEDSENHTYAYKIEGFTDFWSTINENFLRITNLPPGDYTLRIRGKNHSKGWSEDELAFKIHVHKPFYLEWWFLTSLLLATLAAIFFGVKRREQKLQQERIRLESEVQKRTQQIELDKEIIENQAADLMQLDKAKTRFFSNITHEFRTPLTLISGPVEKIIEEYRDSPIHKQLSGVLKNSEHLMGLINQLLDLSKLEGGKMQIEVTRGDIVAHSLSLANGFLSLAEKGQQTLHIESKIPLWETHFDLEKWNKIVYNLLSNALKFTPVGGSIFFIFDKKEIEGKEQLRLRVRDTGKGIEADKIERIFDRFYQADASLTRAQEGTGIGLALVKELIELQGGTITVESELGEGTCFEVLIPVLESTPHVVSRPIPVPDGRTGQASQVALSERRIEMPIPTIDEDKLVLLLVEDNAEMRAYIRSCIDTSVYAVHEAADGAEGLEKAYQIVPDLIVSDVMMPKKNGFELTQAIRTDLRTSHIPLVLLTAKASLESRLEGIERGADAYLTKPFSPKELALRIEKLIELRQLLQQRYSGVVVLSKKDKFEKEDKFIHDLKDYIAKNLEQSDLNGDTIGAYFHISRMQVHRKVKALTGQGISGFIKAQRLEKAIELLQSSEYNISEIAYQTGFSSPSQFSRVFKKKFGKAPSKA